MNWKDTQRIMNQLMVGEKLVVIGRKGKECEVQFDTRDGEHIIRESYVVPDGIRAKPNSKHSIQIQLPKRDSFKMTLTQIEEFADGLPVDCDFRDDNDDSVLPWTCRMDNCVELHFDE
jgi:hypothetical protein